MTTVKDINWKFPVGKYKGQTLEQVSKIDYNYFRWFINVSKDFYFEGDIVDKLRSNISDDGPSSLQIDCERIESYF